MNSATATASAFVKEAFEAQVSRWVGGMIYNSIDDSETEYMNSQVSAFAFLVWDMLIFLSDEVS